MPMPNIVSRAGQLAGKATRFAGRVAVKGAKAGGRMIYEHSGLKDKVESVKNARDWVKRQWNGPSPDDDTGPDRNESDRRDRSRRDSRFERERRSQSDRSTNDAAGERSRQSNDLGQRPLAQLLTRILSTLEKMREDMKKKVQGADDGKGFLEKLVDMFGKSLLSVLMNPKTWAVAAGLIATSIGTIIGSKLNKGIFGEHDEEKPREQKLTETQEKIKNLEELGKGAKTRRDNMTAAGINPDEKVAAWQKELEEATREKQDLNEEQKENMKRGAVGRILHGSITDAKRARNDDRIGKLQEKIAANATDEQRQAIIDPLRVRESGLGGKDVDPAVYERAQQRAKPVENIKGTTVTDKELPGYLQQQYTEEHPGKPQNEYLLEQGTKSEIQRRELNGLPPLPREEVKKQLQEAYKKAHPAEEIDMKEARSRSAEISRKLTAGEALSPEEQRSIDYAQKKKKQAQEEMAARESADKEKSALEAKPVAQVIPADRLKEEQDILNQGQLTASATPSRGAVSDTEGVNAANPSDRKSMDREGYQNLRTETLKKAVSEGRSELTPEETQRLDAAYAESHPNTFGDSDLLVNKKISMEKEIIKARLQQKKPEGDIQSERTSQSVPSGYSDQRSEPGTVTPIPRSQQVETDEMETDESYLSPLSKESKQEYDPLSIPTVAQMYDDRDKADAFVNALNEGKPLSPEHQALAEKYGVRTKETPELEPVGRPSDVSLNKKDERVPGVTPPIDVRVMNKTSEPIPVWLAEVPTVTSESKTTSIPGTTKTTGTPSTPKPKLQDYQKEGVEPQTAQANYNADLANWTAANPTAVAPGATTPSAATLGDLSASTPGFEKVPKAAEQEYKKLSEDELADLKKNVNYKSGSTKFEEGIGGMSASTQRKFYEMAKEYKEATGESLNVSSAYRSAETQNKLSGGKSSASIAAAGSSQHQHGYAMDIDYKKPAGVGGDLTKDEYSPQMKKLREMGLLEKYGFKAGKDSKAQEAWHLDDKNSLTYKKGSEEAKIAKEMSLAGKSGYEIDQALRARKGVTAATSEIKPVTAATPGLEPTATDSTAAPTMTRVKGKSFDSNVEGAISSASKETGVPIEYMRTMAQIESSGKADAHRAGSKYTGLYQFDEATAKGVGVSDRNDAGQAALGAAKLAQQNVAALKKRGIDVDLAKNPELAYLAHQQGAAGASQIIKAAQSGGPVSERLRKTMDANGGKGMDPKQFLSHWKETYQKKAEQVGYKYDSKGEMVADSKSKPEIPAAPTAETKPSVFNREPTVASKVEPTSPAQPELNAALQEQTVSGKLASNPVPTESKPSLFTQPVEPSPLFQNLMDPSGAQLARASFTTESQPSSYSKMSDAVEEGTYDNIKSEQAPSAPIIVNAGGGGGKTAPQGDGGTKMGQQSQMSVRNNDSAIQLLTAGFLSYGMS